MEELMAHLESVAAEQFGADIGTLVRAIDIWEEHPHSMWPVPAWALEARERVIKHIEYLHEQQGGQ